MNSGQFKKGQPSVFKGKLRPNMTGENHPLWKGGKRVTNFGYVQIRVNRKSILEHRYIMEKHLGRKLTKQEHVHHKNGNKIDNRLANLEVINPSKHAKIHVVKQWKKNGSLRKLYD
jgi:hypothetical protein